MRVGAWCAAILALFALVGALRPSQVEGESRISRRLPAPPATDTIDKDETENAVPIFRQRTSRRRDDIASKESVRIRSRNRPTAPSAPEIDSSQSEAGSSERSNTRRTFSRTRNRLTENETTSQRTTASRENFRSRFRTNTRDSMTYTTFPTTDIPTNSDQIETIKVNNYETTKLPSTGQSVSRFDFRSRNPSPSITDNSVPRIVMRGRFSSELGGFSSTTIPSIVEKESTTTRVIDDARTARRLRYKPRLTDTDINLTGPGTTILEESTKSSQNNIITSQLVPQTTMQPIVVDTIAQSSTEKNLATPTTVKITRGLKRPRSRPKQSYKTSSVSKIKSQDEVSEDDNYPESFKALLQARNASTQSNSSLKEGLSVKATQKIYKTFTPPQNTSTSEAKNFSRYRKQILDETNNDTINGEPESGNVSEISSTKKFEYRSRGNYNLRNQKFGSSTTPLTVSSSERRQNKYNINNKLSTESPSPDNDKKQNDIRKFPSRQPYLSRKRVNKNDFTSSEASVSLHNKDDQKRKLSRTSYYARRNNITLADDSSTAESSKEEMINTTPSETETKSLSDNPILFAIVPNSTNDSKNDSTTVLFESENNANESKIFLITVNSKESDENNTSNEVSNNAEESENKLVYNNSPTTPRYHASYKETEQTNVTKGEFINTPSSAPPIKNIQSRKYGRKFSKPKENEDNLYSSPKPRPRHSRKFGESFSKTTEASTNGIQIEPEKVKHKYSSKYRASNLSKPYYKATVPSVTSSTAWLKFFVSDKQLTKSLEEPKWFNGQDLNSTTTETLSNQNTTLLLNSITHESSLQLVEGEETQLGPDMNVISFTKTRSPLSSADLRLSESLMKSSHVMNVEASNHSPSVTVSIFDALAEILTSTQRTRLSTTEVPQIQNTIDVIQSLNGVSNNINVNNTSGLANQDTFMSTSLNVNIVNNQSVQLIEQTTPTVINSLSVVEMVTPSQNIERKITIPVTPVIPTLTPTTPISARRPFAIRILYSETDSPTDKPLTTSGPTSSQPSTGNPTTVFNLLLSNNNLVSSELTSMLSNNIQNIIQNMDEKTRSKISVDMVKLLNSLVPKAVDGLLTSNNDFDVIPNTTPYSLEEIMDTRNIESSDSKKDESISEVTDSPQIVSTIINNVDSFVQNNNNLTGIAEVFQNVNSSNTSLGIENSTASVLNSQIIEKNISVEIDNASKNSKSPISMKSEISDELNTSAIVLVANKNSLSLKNSENVSTNKNLNTTLTPLKIPSKNQKSNNAQSVNTQTLKSYGFSQRQPKNIENFDIQGNQVSPLQLWILSRKARVLKMIEELLLEHNNELATASPLTELLNGPNSIPMSQRLTEIMNTMNLMTTDLNDQFDSTSPISNSYELSSTNSPETEIFTNGIESQSILNEITTKQLETFTTDDIFELQARNAPSATNSSDGADLGKLNNSTTNFEELANTSTFDPTSFIVDPATIEVTTQNNYENTLSTITTEFTNELMGTTSANDLENLKLDLEFTTQLPSTDEKIKEMMTSMIPNNIFTSSVLSHENVATQSAIPKKDYVIFGILPNNTVVRKDPNDDPLASLTEATPFIVYGVLPNNTIIRKFPNGTRVPRVMQKIDILPISPWSLRNPYSPIHNNPAIVRPQSNPFRVFTNEKTTDDINNGTENELTNDTIVFSSSTAHEDWEKPVVTSINIPTSTPNINENSFDITTTVINRLPAEKSTASHVLSLRTTTMLPSIEEILLNSLSSAAKEEMVISSMRTSTYEPRILTLDIDPETKQIRTEKPGDGNGAAVFKFIPIDEVTTPPQDTNVLKLASTKSPITTTTGRPDIQIVTATSFTENSQIPVQDTMTDTTIMPQATVITQTINDKITQGYTDSPSVEMTDTFPPTFTTIPATTVLTTTTTTEAPTITTSATTTPSELTTTLKPATTTTTRATRTPETTIPTTLVPTFTATIIQDSTTATESAAIATTNQILLTTQVTTPSNFGGITKNQEDIKLLASLLQAGERSGKSLILPTNNPLNPTSTTFATDRVQDKVSQDNQALLQALLAAANNPSTLVIKKNSDTSRGSNKIASTTLRSIEDDIRQFEQDTRLLKALLQATGQNPAKFNIPSLSSIQASSKLTTTPTPPTKTVSTTSPTTPTTSSIVDEITKYEEDAKLLQALLQSTIKLSGNEKIPMITGITSNVRVNSNPLTTSLFSNPTTPISLRPIYTSRTTPTTPVFTTTSAPSTIPVTNILQSRQPITTEAEDVRISTTFSPITQVTTKLPTTRRLPTALSERKVPSFFSTTEVPSTSTFSVEEDIMFLQNLKTVLGNSDSDSNDPESTLANRIIALAVERSLNEIQSDKKSDSQRSGKAIANSVKNRISTTPTTTTTTITTTTTTPRPTTTVKQSTPSIEDDIRQFQQDTKLLQALLKATGQDASKFNIPILNNNNAKVTSKVPAVDADLQLLSNLLASPSPLNEPFDSLTKKPLASPNVNVPKALRTTTKPFGAKITVKDDLKTVQDEVKLLQTLIKLQDVQEPTTQKSKLAITGQSTDEALKKLIQQKPTGMVPEATKASVTLSTEYGKSNDALLAALLKEQGFGPTTASSLDEQIRLAALLNQVVVTPKRRKTTTTTPTPPPAPRRPILDGLAWLWQQWRETAPGPTVARPSRRPASAPAPASSATATSNRVNWFGSGPFVGNADDKPSSNRIPLEPPRVVASEQTDGRGQLVSAAINVTRAFSQFLGAALQGAAQTVQNVIKAGQRAATDVYMSGSGSG